MKDVSHHFDKLATLTNWKEVILPYNPLYRLAGMKRQPSKSQLRFS